MYLKDLSESEIKFHSWYYAWKPSYDDDSDGFLHYDDDIPYLCINIEGNDLCLFLTEDNFHRMYPKFDISSKGFINIPSKIEHERKIYNVKYLYLSCLNWRLSLPASIQDVIIDRTPFTLKGYIYDTISKFKVADDNQYLCADNYSLYSKNKEILYHYHGYDNPLYPKKEDIKLAKELKTILPEAFRGDFYGITIPRGVSRIMKNAFVGRFNGVLDFQGKLTCIEKDSISNIHELRINGLLNDLSSESREELKKWKKESSENEIIFAAPKDLPKSPPIAGYIHLAGVIENNLKPESRVGYDRDYKEVKLNACIHSQIRESRLPIMIEEIKLKYMYNPEEKGTRITFFTRENINKEQTAYVDVYETPDEVLTKIKEAVETHQ